MVLCKAELYNEDIKIGTGETTGTNYNEAINSFNQVISHQDKIAEQREKALKMLKCDKSEAWGDGILVWCNAARTQPSVQLGMNGRYLPFIVDGKDDVFNSGLFKNESAPMFDGKRRLYDTFDKSGHGAGIQVDKVKYVINKALEPNLIVKNKKRCYYFSDMVEVTKQARMDDQSE
eukprot:7547206-Ditylum_brightwellii.AAC.1